MTAPPPAPPPPFPAPPPPPPHPPRVPWPSRGTPPPRPGGPGGTGSSSGSGAGQGSSVRRAPRDCPVCASGLEVTRLSCPECATELSGTFASCEFCALGDEDRTLLRVFLASRGNMKDLERHLGVSYPTARARFDALLGRLGIERPAVPGEGGGEQLTVLEDLARGSIDVDEALRRIT